MLRGSSGDASSIDDHAKSDSGDLILWPAGDAESGRLRWLGQSLPLKFQPSTFWRNRVIDHERWHHMDVQPASDGRPVCQW